MVAYRARMDRELSDREAQRRGDLERALERAISRVERRIEAVKGDLERIAGADAMAQRAQLFVAEAARAPRGAAKLVAVDWSSGEERSVELPLDPARGAHEQVAAMFRRARRLKDGAKVARARLAEARRVRGVLAETATALSTQPDADVDALIERARHAAPRDFRLSSSAATGKKRARRDEPLPPHHTFIGASGARILVGRGAAHNDELTLHVARPRDLWLHAKNRTGAHVVVPLAKGTSCPADLLVEAAHLAAHFSEARGETTVEVTYTPRRYVRKPRGSAPGLVAVDREKVITLRANADLLKKLLERETSET